MGTLFLVFALAFVLELVVGCDFFSEISLI